MVEGWVLGAIEAYNKHVKLNKEMLGNNKVIVNVVGLRNNIDYIIGDQLNNKYLKWIARRLI